jgi:hypothetical protein
MNGLTRELNSLDTATGRWAWSAAFVTLGAAAGWAAQGRLSVVIGGSACMLAAMNGYSKSYSP